jgi:hypothetical protein
MGSFYDLLFARGGFLVGIGRVLDIGGGYARYNSSLTPAEADALALYADWRTVGGDLEAGLRATEEWEEQPWGFLQPEQAHI